MIRVNLTPRYIPYYCEECCHREARRRKESDLYRRYCHRCEKLTLPFASTATVTPCSRNRLFPESDHVVYELGPTSVLTERYRRRGR